MGNLIRVTEPNPAGGADLVTNYTYDALNHLTQVGMPRQGFTQTRTFNYDPSTQRLSSVQTPESGTTSYSYNGDGTIQSKTDAKGQQIQYTYDQFQRVTKSEAYPAGASQPDPCQTVDYQYDQWTIAEIGTLSNGFGRLTGVYWASVASGTNPNTGEVIHVPRTGCPYAFGEEYAYTAVGQVFLKRMTMATPPKTGPQPIVLTGAFAFDAEGRLQSFTPPGVDTLHSALPGFSYDRDALGRPVGMRQWTPQGVTPQQSTLVVTGVNYTGGGQMLGMTFAGQYTETRQYNESTTGPADGGTGVGTGRRLFVQLCSGQQRPGGVRDRQRERRAGNVYL
jgi:YD repeat-containing protein